MMNMYAFFIYIALLQQVVKLYSLPHRCKLKIPLKRNNLKENQKQIIQPKVMRRRMLSWGHSYQVL